MIPQFFFLLQCYYYPWLRPFLTLLALGKSAVVLILVTCGGPAEKCSFLMQVFANHFHARQSLRQLIFFFMYLAVCIIYLRSLRQFNYYMKSSSIIL
jgi:hypothetical protein